MINWTKFIDWMKQPSTLKAFVIVAGAAGWRLSPDAQDSIVFVTGVIYVGLQAFYEQQPRKPIEPTPPAEAPLTESRFRELLAEAKAKRPSA